MICCHLHVPIASCSAPCSPHSGSFPCPPGPLTFFNTPGTVQPPGFVHWLCPPPRRRIAHPTHFRAPLGITFSPPAPLPLLLRARPLFLSALSSQARPLFLLLPASLSPGGSSLWAGLCVDFGHCIAQCQERCLQAEYLQNEWMIRGGNACRVHSTEEKSVRSAAGSLGSV